MKKGPVTLSSITNCARCGGTHESITFKPFTHALNEYTHYAPCPTTHEPILLTFTPDKPKSKKAKA